MDNSKLKYSKEKVYENIKLNDSIYKIGVKWRIGWKIRVRPLGFESQRVRFTLFIRKIQDLLKILNEFQRTRHKEKDWSDL